MNAAETLERTMQARQKTALLGTSSHLLLQSFLAQIQVAASYGRNHATVHKIGYCDIDQVTLRTNGFSWKERLSTETVLTAVDLGWFNEALRGAIEKLQDQNFAIHLHLRPDGENTVVPFGKPLYVKRWSAYLVVGWADEDWYDRMQLDGAGVAFQV